MSWNLVAKVGLPTEIGRYWLWLDGHELPILAYQGYSTLDNNLWAVDQDNGDFTGKIERVIVGWIKVPPLGGSDEG